MSSSATIADEEEMTCVTGTISVEDISEEVYYDDTQVKACALGQTKCYKQQLSMLVENNWPGIWEFTIEIHRLVLVCITLISKINERFFL